MGARAPSKLKLRRPTYKCDSCDRKFLSAQALKSHKICMHEIKSKRRPDKDKTKLTNLLGKAVKKQGEPAVTTVKMSEARVQRKAPVAVVEKSVPTSESRKIEFECPQCLKLFGAYFTAYRHIQKYHCINDKGQKVLSSAADLIKPVRIEICKKCDMRVRADTLHLCSDRFMFPNLLALSYICAGCKQKFSSIQLFDLHVSGVHCDGIESYFFPTLAEFRSWKNGVEDATDTKYLILGQCNTKQIYRCTNLPPTTNEDDKVAQICPATIVVREYSKGIQVHFYKQHHGHPSDEYRVPESYKKYTITTMMQRTNFVIENKDAQSNLGTDGERLILIDPLSDESDLYVQFKTLMDTVVVDAAKLNIQMLKVLVGKALEMSMVISQYVEDEELGDVPKPTYLNKHMSDNEIVDALESFKKNMKRRLDSPAPDMKKMEIDATDSSKIPMILNTFSLADESKETTIPNAKNKDLVDVSPVTQTSENTLLNLYKKEKVRQKKMVKEIPRIVKPKEAGTLKDKEKQDMNTTPDKIEKGRISVKKEFRTDFKDSPKSKKTVVESPKSKKTVVESPNSISCFNDCYKEFVVKNFKPSKNKSEDTNSNNNVVSTTTTVKAVTRDVLQNDTAVPIPLKEEDSNIVDEVQTKLLTPLRKKVNRRVTQVIKAKANSQKGRIVSKKKVMKTKIGQFKPSLSPKNVEPVKVFRSAYGRRKVKADLDYEVKKQDNDVNILILKF